MRTARLFLSICLCLITGHSFAQDYIYATGNPSFAVNVPVENGFINITNGNLHMEFPLATHKQRGALQLNERLIYDSRIWRILPPSSSTIYYGFSPSNTDLDTNTPGGWRFVTGAEAGTTSVESWINQQGYCEFQSGLQYSYGTDVVTWSDSSGASHTFDAPWPENHNDCNPSPGQVSMTGYATDGSGYSVQLSGSNDAEPSSIIVHDNNGNQVYPQVIDRYGNYWSNDSNGNLIDDLGRTPVITTQNGSVTYYDVLAPNGPINNNGTRVRYTVTTAPVWAFTHFNQSGVSEWPGNLYPVQSIQLPDGSSYTFTYDSYGEMSTVTLPTGGVITYGWTNYQDSYQNKNRWLTSRTVGSDPATTFTPAVITQCSSNETGCKEQVTVHKPGGDETVYELTLNNGAWNTNVAAYSGPASPANAILSTANIYDFSHPCNSPICTGAQYIKKSLETTTLSGTGLTTQKEIDYANPAVGKPTALKEWDYYTGTAPATPTRETDYSYTGYDLSEEIQSENGQVSKTNYDYTATATTTHDIDKHGTANAGGPYLTTVRRWLNTNGLTQNTNYAWEDTGSLLSSTDPYGQTTTYAHDSTDTYVTGVTQPTPSSGVVLSTGVGYDVSTDAMTSTTDENGQTTWYQGFDPMGRPHYAFRPDGGRTYYNFGNTANAYQNGVAVLRGAGIPDEDTETLYDSFGRVSRKAVYNGQGTNPFYIVDSCYDVDGRLQFQSPPYQSTGFDAAKQCSGTGTTYAYDGLDRVKSVTSQDGTALYDYAGRAVKTTDPNGVQKITQSDAFGRISAVCEVSSNSLKADSPQNCGLDIAGSGYLTTYAYNGPNHTTTITQGLQTRLFQTDSLGRPIKTQEPEAGETTYDYTYNATGLQVTRTRPKANTTNIDWKTHTTTQYDKVGRVLSVSYDDGTPSKTYGYDQATAWGQGGLSLGYSKGHLTSMIANPPTNWNGGGFFIYDVMGRVATQAQCFPSGCGNGALDKYLSYTYDKAGNMTSSSDGAGATTTYQYSPASEVTSVTSSISNSSNPSALVSNVQNGVFGPTSWTLGNGLSGYQGYDWAGRTSLQRVCTGTPGASCTSQYGLNVFRNSSGIYQTDDSVANASVGYGYDEFGRLKSSNIRPWPPGSPPENYTYSYDRYGNRWSQQPGPSPTFDETKNQINDSGHSYDAAGNMMTDANNTYVYDAEGNVIRVINLSGTSHYYYNALNQRVQVITSSNQAFEYVYNLSGKPVSIWDGYTNAFILGQYYWGGTQLAYYGGGSVHFQHQDWLGTERVRTTYNGSVEETFNSLPFGDGVSTLSNTDTNLFHFAQLEHDPESGTEHAQFRQYSSRMGVWLAPDPYLGSMDLANPQSFNRYAYVSNNPLTGIDPTGLAPEGGSPISAGAGCIGAVALGQPEGCAIGLLYNFFSNWFSGFFDSLGGPSFNGTTQPRPGGTIWDEHGGFHATPYSSIAGMLGDVGGWSPSGCEFGACGGSFAAKDPPGFFSPTRFLPDEILNAYATFERYSRKLDKQTLKFLCKSSPDERIMSSIKGGAVLGALQGGYKGAVAGAEVGSVLDGVGAVPGAVIGGTVRAVAGAGGGVFKGPILARACSAVGAYDHL